jgi:hypothetical protein
MLATVIVNVDPFPGALSTVTVPPSCSELVRDRGDELALQLIRLPERLLERPPLGEAHGRARHHEVIV